MHTFIDFHSLGLFSLIYSFIKKVCAFEPSRYNSQSSWLYCEISTRSCWKNTERSRRTMWKLLMLINSQATSYQSMDVEIDPQYRGGVKKQLIFHLIHFYQRLDRRQRNLDVHRFGWYHRSPIARDPALSQIVVVILWLLCFAFHLSQKQQRPSAHGLAIRRGKLNGHTLSSKS